MGLSSIAGNHYFVKLLGCVGELNINQRSAANLHFLRVKPIMEKINAASGETVMVYLPYIRNGSGGCSFNRTLTPAIALHRARR